MVRNNKEELPPPSPFAPANSNFILFFNATFGFRYLYWSSQLSLLQI